MTRTHAGQDFDPRIADWLEADPDHAPAIVLDTVLAAFPSIPQRRATRVPWRFLAMYRYALLGTAAVAIVAIVIGGYALRPGPFAPGPSTSASPSPSPSHVPIPSGLGSRYDLSQRVESDLYHYSIATDSRWTFSPASLPVGDPRATDDTGRDHLTITGTDTTVNISRIVIPRQYTYSSDFLAATRQRALNDSSGPAGCMPRESSPPRTIRVGDEIGHVVERCDFEAVFVPVDGFAVVIEFDWSNETFDSARHFDRADFEELLGTVTFDEPTSIPESRPSP